MKIVFEYSPPKDVAQECLAFKVIDGRKRKINPDWTWWLWSHADLDERGNGTVSFPGKSGQWRTIEAQAIGNAIADVRRSSAYQRKMESRQAGAKKGKTRVTEA